MSKKTPLKARIVGLFAESSPMMKRVSQAAYLAVLNLCWLITSLPIVTGGAALTALYTVLNEVDSHAFEQVVPCFWRAFRRNLLSSFPCWAFFVAIAGLLGTAWRTALSIGLTNNFALMLPLLLVSLVFAFLFLRLFPMQAAAPQPLLRALSTALLAGLADLPRSFAALLTELLCWGLAIFCALRSLTLFGIWVLFAYAFFAWLRVLLYRPRPSAEDTEDSGSPS